MSTEENEILKNWIRKAAPMLETACCIAFDKSEDHFNIDLEGCRGLLETCPIDFERDPEAFAE